MLQRCRRLIHKTKIIKQMRLVNIFRSLDSHTERDIKNEFLSTRIYFILFSVAVIIVIEYYTFVVSTDTITLDSPSFDTVLQYNETILVCPCTTSVVPYGSFASVTPVFHPICSSDFITDTWLNLLDVSIDEEIVQFRMPLRLLRLFCQLAHQTLDVHLRQLYQSNLLTFDLSTEAEMRTKTDTSIEVEISTARLAFAASFELGRNISKVNLLVSANEIFQTNRAKLLVGSNGRIEFRDMYDRDSAVIPCNKNARLANITFDQFVVKCDAIKALLISSFASFYDIGNVEALSYSVINSSSRPLNRSISYLTTATVQEILNKLMLDTYATDISYRSYFDKCDPQTCTYSVTSGKNFVEIVLAVIGFIGGLAPMLHWVVHVFVQFITRPTVARQPNITWRRKVDNLMTIAQNHILTVNLFRHSGKSQWYEIISTRVFMCSFFLILMIFLFDISLTSTTILVTTSKPTHAQFIALDHQKWAGLTCPCSILTVAHHRFLTFTPQLHQVCSSGFVSDAWQASLSEQIALSYNSDDFRSGSYYIFYAIDILCKLSRQIVDERIGTFSATQFVSSKVLSEKQWEEQIDQLFKVLVQVGEKQLSTVLKLIRDTTYCNQVSEKSIGNQPR